MSRDLDKYTVTGRERSSCVWVFVGECVHVCVFMCVCVRGSICVHVCGCVYAYEQAHAQGHAYVFFVYNNIIIIYNNNKYSIYLRHISSNKTIQRRITIYMNIQIT